MIITISQRLVLAAVFAGVGIASFAGAIATEACTPAQEQTIVADATKVAPYLQYGCNVASDSEIGAPYVEFVCSGLEATDKLLSQIPGGQVVAYAAYADAGVGKLLVTTRVRCPIRWATDGGIREASDVDHG